MDEIAGCTTSDCCCSVREHVYKQWEIHEAATAVAALLSSIALPLSVNAAKLRY